jgi:DNA invertase Pin-like site-specific DNA recombinase
MESNMLLRAYLRASTIDQDAERARAELERFASERSLTIAAFYVENASGTALARPELMRLLNDCRPGDGLLVEQIDRLTRLNADDWASLRRQIADRQIRIISLDVPSTWTFAQRSGDEVQSRVLDAINTMLVDILSAMAHADYLSRRKRQAQGIASAKAKGVYVGKRENVSRNTAIIGMLAAKTPWSAIVAATGCSRSTLSRLAKRVPKTEMRDA